MQPSTKSSLKTNLDLLLAETRNTSSISIRRILEILSENGRFLILIFLSLPFCQPLQIPGLAIPFGMIIALIGIRMSLGKSIWLPNTLLSRQIPSTTFEKILRKTLSIMYKIGRLIRPRLPALCDPTYMRILNGLLIAFLGILLALPIPIFLTNTAASWSILLISVGLLENDGLCIVLGYLVSALTILFFLAILLSVKYIFH